MGRGASNCRGEIRSTGLAQRRLCNEPFLNHTCLPLPSLKTWLTASHHPNALPSTPEVRRRALTRLYHKYICSTTI